MNQWVRSIASGAAGAAALTCIHELARRRIPNAPRMDLVAMRGLRRMLPSPEEGELQPTELHKLALAGDLVANSVYYAAIPARTAKETWTRAAILGIAAGTGALALPEPMGLGSPPNSHSSANRAMTIAWYVAGAVATAAVATALSTAADR